MNGDNRCATATSVPDGENATPLPVPLGRVAGFENFVPKPEEDQVYAETIGLRVVAITISVPDGENFTEFPPAEDATAGFAYLAPKPDAVQG